MDLTFSAKTPTEVTKEAGAGESAGSLPEWD